MSHDLLVQMAYSLSIISPPPVLNVPDHKVLLRLIGPRAYFLEYYGINTLSSVGTTNLVI